MVLWQLTLSAVAAWLVWAGIGLPLGWLVVLAALFVFPGARLARWLGICDGPASVLFGIPLGLGLQVPMFVVAALLHFAAPDWGLLALALATATAALRPRPAALRSVELRPSRAQALMLLIVLGAALGAVAVSGRDSDDWTYGADIADYRAGYALAASDPVLGTDIPMIPRERLDIWIGGLGVAARASNSSVPSLLQDQLPIVVAASSLLATYALGTIIGGATEWGLASVIIELAWFAVTSGWPALGDAFLTRVGQDKVAATVLLAPVLLAAVLVMERGLPRAPRLMIALLAGLGIAGVHPVTHAILFAVLLAWAALGTVFEGHRNRDRWLVALVFGAPGVIAAYGYLAARNLGPAPGTSLAADLANQALAITAGKDAVWRRLPGVILNPDTVRNALSVPMAAIAFMSYVIKRDARTALVAAGVVTVVGLAFDPLLTPIISSSLSDSYGLGLLIRVPWVLPVPFAFAALAFAWRERAGIRVPLAALTAVVLVAAMCVSELPSSVRAIEARRANTWRELPGVAPVMSAIASRAAIDDVALVPKAIEFRIGAYAPTVKLLASRGAIGTIPHFRRRRVPEAVARVTVVNDFFAPDHPSGWSAEDVDTINRYAVRFLVLADEDPRIVVNPGLQLTKIASGGGYTAFTVGPSP
jgi:hypothetical protein